MKGAALLARILGEIAALSYLVCMTGWAVVGTFLAICVATSVVAILVSP